MKSMKLFTVLALFGISNAVLGGTIKFVNTTDKLVYIAVDERASGLFGRTREFSYSVGPRNAYSMTVGDNTTVTFNSSFSPIPSGAQKRYQPGSGSRNYTVKFGLVGTNLSTDIMVHD